MRTSRIDGFLPQNTRWALGAALAACLLSAGAAPGQEYAVNAGDLLEIIVVDEPILTPAAPGLVVGPDGRITMPYVGSVEVAGKTCAEISETLRTALIEAEILIAPEVIVRVADYRSQTVNVLGAVGVPGRYSHRPGLTIRDAVALAGGLVEAGEGAASRAEARLVRPTGEALTIVLAEALQGQGPYAQLALEPGDTLIVEIRQTVSVTGAVGAPGAFSVDGATKLAEVVTRAGGVAPTGDPENVTVRKPDGTVRTVNLHRVLTGEVADVPTVEPGDVVFVPPARRANVLGYVKAPGSYQLNPNDLVRDLLAAAGSVARPTGGGAADVRGDARAVVLTRADGRSVTLDMDRVLAGGLHLPELDPLVAAGDTIFVPEERLEVSVLGHVVTPGRYPFRVGDRATDALAAAGGPLRATTVPAETTAADLANCQLMRASGQMRKLDLSRLAGGERGVENPELEPGDTLFVPEADNHVTVSGYVAEPGYYIFRPGDTVRTAIAMAGGVLTNVGTLTEVVVTHGDGAKETLDLETADAALRTGDDISVPYARLRVAVLGYVNEPGVYEWHEGDTVADMIAQAGGVVVDVGDFYHAVLIRKRPGAEKEHPTWTPGPAMARMIRESSGRTEDGQFEVVDLSKLYDNGDKAGNPEVRPNDIIFVPKSDHTNYEGWLGNITEGLVIWNLLDGIF